MREGEDQQAAAGQTRDEHAERHAGNAEPGERFVGCKHEQGRCCCRRWNLHFIIRFFHLNLRKSSCSVLCFGQALLAEQESKDSGGASIAEQVLSIMEIILDEANAEISEDKVSFLKLTSK